MGAVIVQGAVDVTSLLPLGDQEVGFGSTREPVGATAKCTGEDAGLLREGRGEKEGPENQHGWAVFSQAWLHGLAGLWI